MGKYLQTAWLTFAPLLCVAGCHRAPEMASPQTAQVLGTPVSSTPPNGFALLVRAARSLQKDDKRALVATDKLSPAENLKQSRASIQQNAISLQLMQQALKLPIKAPPKHDSKTDFVFYSGLRNLARLCVQRSRVLAADRQWNRAIESPLDAVQMGAASQNGADVIGMLVGDAAEAIGRKELQNWRTLSHCDAATLLAASQRLASIDANRTTLAAIMQAEKATGLMELQKLFASPKWKLFRGGDNKTLSSELWTEPKEIKRLRTFSDRAIRDNYVLTMDKIIAQARQPTNHLTPTTPPRDPLSQSFTSLWAAPKPNKPLSSTRFHWERNNADHRLLTVALALQAIATTTGKYPQFLDELVPKYLQGVPRDPFFPNQPLHYRRTANSYVLYSFGPDGVDNGGAPIHDRYHLVGRSSHGDIAIGFFR